MDLYTWLAGANCHAETRADGTGFGCPPPMSAGTMIAATTKASGTDIKISGAIASIAIGANSTIITPVIVSRNSFSRRRLLRDPILADSS
jgi:hypothetical protein